MYKKNLLLIGLAVALIMSACKKDKNETNPNDPNAVPPSSKAVETMKGDLETTGDDLLGYMEDMEQLTGIEVLMNLASIAEEDDEVVMEVMKQPSEIVMGIKSKDPSTVFDAISIVSEDPFEEGPPTLAELMDEFGGTWNYDPVEDDLIQASSSTTEIVLNFPGDDDDMNTNNATITINNLSSTVVENDELYEEPIELPTSMHMDLKYNGNELMGWDFTASFTADAYPTAINSNLYIDDYSFSVEFKHTPFSSASNKLSLKYQDQILIETYQEVGGNWTQENIENSIVEVEDEYYDYTEFHFEEVINNGNAYIQIMNVKLMGVVNFKVIGDKIWELEEQEEDDIITEEEYFTQLAATINENAALGLVYVDPLEKICDFKAKAKQYEDEYYDYWLEDYVTETYWDMGADLHFADGSVVDAETYFTEEFGELLEDFMDFGGFIEE